MKRARIKPLVSIPVCKKEPEPIVNSESTEFSESSVKVEVLDIKEENEDTDNKDVKIDEEFQEENGSSSTLECSSTTKKRDFSEMSKKLLRSKREFYLKNCNKVPDRKKLKMYDLIYYNPSGEKDDGRNGANSDCETEDGKDKPVEKSKKCKKDLNFKNRIPCKKNYVKAWSQKETKEFFDALSFYGTDFSLMQHVTFPNRTVAQIKAKYKKEDKLNPQLVEKALSKNNK